jgi:hypothetical protein
MNHRNHLSKEQVMNTDHHYSFMKPIRKHNHFRSLGIYSLKIIINSALFQEILWEPLSILIKYKLNNGNSENKHFNILAFD